MKINRKKTWIALVTIVSFTASSALHATEKQIADLEEDIAALKAQIEELGGPGNAATQLLANIETAEQEIEKAKEALPEKEKAIAAKSYLLGIYQSAFRVVTSMVAGENLGTVQLNTGEVIPGASFIKVENGGILVQTGTGSRTLPISQLPAALSGKLTLPPAIPPMSMTFDSVKASKPDILKTKGEIAASPGSRPAGTTAAPVTNPADPSPSSTAAAPAPSATASDDYAQIQQRNAARQKRILQIKERYSQLYLQKKKARTDKAEAEAGFRSAKIKKSRNEIDSTMAIHNSKIEQIEAEEAELRTEMTRIQAEFE